MKRPLPYFALLTLLSVCSIPVMGQSAGYDLFQTGSGISVDLSSLGLGVVNLQGVAIQGSSGNTDTIVHRTQNVPSGGGAVSVNVYALFMKSTSSVTLWFQRDAAVAVSAVLQPPMRAEPTRKGKSLRQRPWPCLA